MSVEASKGNQGDKAVEMAGRIGSDVIQASSEWQNLERLDLASFLQSIGEELGFAWTEWKVFLVQSGSWIISSLENKFLSLESMVVEQNTSVGLREDFGVPASNLALGVFARLANMEAQARKILQMEAQSATSLLENLKVEVMNHFALFVADKLNQLDEEGESVLATLNSAEEETKGQEVLNGVRELTGSRLNSNLDEIEKRRRDLIALFEKVGRKFTDTVRVNFETTIFSASRQSTAITAIT